MFLNQRHLWVKSILGQVLTGNNIIDLKTQWLAARRKSVWFFRFYFDAWPIVTACKATMFDSCYLHQLFDPFHSSNGNNIYSTFIYHGRKLKIKFMPSLNSKICSKYNRVVRYINALINYIFVESESINSYLLKVR